ncbi:hypothetical protein [Streptomyces agglomeratus]|nr:hypothetical protein [Streptomyces agglomeratus]
MQALPRAVGTSNRWQQAVGSTPDDDLLERPPRRAVMEPSRWIGATPL